MDQLLEDRMKELSANDMEVWLYDVKRNLQVRCANFVSVSCSYSCC